jgi:hypothetical protein
MNSDMTFECLVVSRDLGLFANFERALRKLSISIQTCLSPSRDFDLLTERSGTDLIVVDCDAEESKELLRKLWRSDKRHKPTVVAVSSCNSPAVIAHFVIDKPLTPESIERCLKSAYSRMLLEHRRVVRHVLMLPVTATFDDGRAVPVTVTDIGDGGVGLNAKDAFTVGDVLSFRLPLSGAPRQILIHARVSWTRAYGRAGCEFVRIPPVDLIILHDWLKARTTVRSPASIDRNECRS